MFPLLWPLIISCTALFDSFTTSTYATSVLIIRLTNVQLEPITQPHVSKTCFPPFLTGFPSSPSDRKNGKIMVLFPTTHWSTSGCVRNWEVAKFVSESTDRNSKHLQIETKYPQRLWKEKQDLIALLAQLGKP